MPKLDADNSALAMVYRGFKASVACMPPPAYKSPEGLPFFPISQLFLVKFCLFLWNFGRIQFPEFWGIKSLCLSKKKSENYIL